MSDKKRLMKSTPRPIEFEDVPGEKFTIRQLKVRERSAMLAAKDKSQDEQANIMVAYFLGDENGDRVFQDDQIADASELMIGIQEKIIREGNEYNFAKIEEKKT